MGLAKILLVESEESWASLVCAALSECQIDVASDADEAMGKLGKPGDYAAMIINLQLPKNNGIEILNERVSHVDLLAIPAIVYSSERGYSKVSDEAWQAYHVSAYIDQNELVKRLSQAVSEVLNASNHD